MAAVIRTYYMLTKPGIIMGNLMTMLAGFALGSLGAMHYGVLLATLLGLGCIIASSCVYNNSIDRHADKKMLRTQNRPLAQGLISLSKALLFATLLGLVGVSILILWTNTLTVIGAVIGFFFYVIMYSFLKHVSSYATLIGSISGAMPPVIGYVAAGNRFDSGAILLFVILVLWQMPHFYAIAIYRFEDYLAASIPVLPIKRGMYITKLRSLFYIVVFILATFALAPLGYMGYLYAVIMTLFGGGWLILGLKNFKSQNDKAWARTMFFASLIVIMALCILMIIESYEGQLKALF